MISPPSAPDQRPLSSAPLSPAGSVVPVPPDPELSAIASARAPHPVVYRSGREFVCEYGGVPPVEICVRCGRATERQENFSLRDLRNPRTWFGRRPLLELGLCRKHREDHTIAVALTWSVLAVGAMLTIVGFLTFSWFSLLLGMVAMAASGFFRAKSPVTSSQADENHLVVRGAGEGYLRSLPSPPVDQG